MPNKLFEYIQARLAIIAAPLFDIKEFIDEYHVGKVTQSFESDSLAKTINSLDEKNILYYKNICDKLAETFSQKNNDDKLMKILKKLGLNGV